MASYPYARLDAIRSWSFPGSNTCNFVTISRSPIVKLCINSLSLCQSGEGGNGPIDSEVKWLLNTDAKSAQVIVESPFGLFKTLRMLLIYCVSMHAIL